MEKLQPAFYAKKSILRKWIYSVMFFDDRLSNTIKAHHVVDISVPFYEFEATANPYGSVTKSFTTLQKDRGLQFGLTVEEDRFGSITKLIHVLQRTILNQNGVYNSLDTQVVGDIRVIISDDAGTDVMAFQFKNCRFVGADSFSLSYADNDSLKHKINFICDVASFDYLINTEDANMSEVPIMPLPSVKENTSLTDQASFVPQPQFAGSLLHPSISDAAIGAIPGANPIDSVMGNGSKISKVVTTAAMIGSIIAPKATTAVAGAVVGARGKVQDVVTSTLGGASGAVAKAQGAVTAGLSSAGGMAAKALGGGVVGGLAGGVVNSAATSVGTKIAAPLMNTASGTVTKGVSSIKAGFSKVSLF